MADVLEISRQQVSAWENGIKPISENRLRQLSKYFGLEEKYFLGISEEDKAFLISKGLYRRQDCDKEVYCFLKQGEVEDDSKYRSFSYPDFDESLDEQMTKAKKKKQGTLQKVEEAIGYLKQMPNETIPMRMIYFDMVKNVLNSLLLANGLKTKEEIEEEFAFVMSCTMMLIGFMNSPDYLKINMRKKEI